MMEVLRNLHGLENSLQMIAAPPRQRDQVGGYDIKLKNKTTKSITVLPIQVIQVSDTRSCVKELTVKRTLDNYPEFLVCK